MRLHLFLAHIECAFKAIKQSEIVYITYNWSFKSFFIIFNKVELDFSSKTITLSYFTFTNLSCVNTLVLTCSQSKLLESFIPNLELRLYYATFLVFVWYDMRHAKCRVERQVQCSAF